MYEQGASPVPLPMLVVLILWLAIIFVSFGLFAPRNGTVVASLCVAALSVSCAILLILEMYRPFEGIIQISSAPLYTALAHLGGRAGTLEARSPPHHERASSTVLFRGEFEVAGLGDGRGALLPDDVGFEFVERFQGLGHVGRIVLFEGHLNLAPARRVDVVVAQGQGVDFGGLARHGRGQLREIDAMRELFGGEGPGRFAVDLQGVAAGGEARAR